MTRPLMARIASRAWENSPSKDWPSAAMASLAMANTRRAALRSAAGTDEAAMVTAERIEHPLYQTTSAPQRASQSFGGRLAAARENRANCGEFPGTVQVQNFFKGLTRCRGSVNHLAGFGHVVFCARGIPCLTCRETADRSDGWPVSANEGQPSPRAFSTGLGSSRPPHKGEARSVQWAKMSTSSQPARSNAARDGRKSKQAWANWARPSRASMVSSVSFRRWRKATSLAA